MQLVVVDSDSPVTKSETGAGGVTGSSLALPLTDAGTGTRPDHLHAHDLSQCDVGGNRA